jgi:hypothetical protein
VDGELSAARCGPQAVDAFNTLDLDSSGELIGGA